MSGHLLAVEIGPVEGFIAAARKTLDLWFGSWLISEVAKAAARKVRDLGGELVFPAATDAQLLRESDYTVADTILARIDTTTPMAAVASAVKAAVHGEWCFHSNAVRDKMEKDGGYFTEFLRADVWAGQTPAAVPAGSAGEVFECYAAWVPLSADFGADRERLMHLLAGRTARRNFPPADGRAVLPRSSLDGGARDGAEGAAARQEAVRAVGAPPRP